ncbi:class I SAM-dependent methyltransferase [Planctomycetota bacterium]|nr:class I SAM-dependent methyltransferase [Planctomycetota bacterium]
MKTSNTTSKKQLAYIFDTWFKLFPNAEPPDATSTDIDILINSLNLQTNHTIWDLGCGTGRHLRELASRNYINLQGIDLSETALTYAQQNNPNNQINYINSDFRTYLTKEDHNADIIYSLDFTFSLFPEDELTRLLQAAMQRINRRGYICIEMWDSQSVVHNHAMNIQRTHQLPHGNFTYQSQYQPEAQTLVFTHSFQPENQPLQILPPQVHYIYHDQQMKYIANRAGLALTKSHQPVSPFGRHYIFQSDS